MLDNRHIRRHSGFNSLNGECNLLITFLIQWTAWHLIRCCDECLSYLQYCFNFSPQGLIYARQVTAVASIIFGKVRLSELTFAVLLLSKFGQWLGMLIYTEPAMDVVLSKSKGQYKCPMFLLHGVHSAMEDGNTATDEIAMYCDKVQWCIWGLPRIIY